MYNIEEALKEQIKYCHELPRYRCGIYINHPDKKDYVMDILKEILIQDDSVVKAFNSKYEAVINFENGSSIRIIKESENVRGCKNHGAIIDNEIEKEILNCIIMPALIPRWFEEDKRESLEEVKKRIFYCNL